MWFLCHFTWVFLMKFFFPFPVPPSIDDSLSSSDVIVREGSNVTLKCRAHGSPQPTIKWKRDDSTKINVNKSTSGMQTFDFLLNFNWKFSLSLKSLNWTRKCLKYREYHAWIWERIYASRRTQFHPALAKGLESVLTVSKD